MKRKKVKFILDKTQLKYKAIRQNCNAFFLSRYHVTTLPHYHAFNRRSLWACLFVLLLSVPIRVYAAQAILAQFNGNVEVQSKTATVWRKAVRKMLLKEGEKIRTGPKSKATLLFEDGSRTVLSEKTTMTMTQLTTPVNLQQSEGRSRNKVKKLGRGFTMRTPTAICSVRGTDFSVGIGEGGATKLDVFEGVVNGLKLATGQSMDVGAGQSLGITSDRQPMETPTPITPGEESSAKQLARKEVGLDMTREQIQQAAAEEAKLAEYQEGKSLIDVNGFRVRVEEYILRKPKDVPAADRDKAFKFVVLNSREGRLDFFTYKGIFNKTLPEDLSVALKNVSGRQLGDEPEFYLRSYEMTQSNLTDAIKDMADGGHLVKVTFDGTTYTLQAYSVASDGKAGSVTDTATQLASANSGVYDPIADVYRLPGASMDGIYDPSNDTFKTMKTGDTLWRTQFNRYGHLIGSAKELASLTLDNVPSGTLSKPWFQYYTAATGVTNIATLESINNATLSTSGTMTIRGKTVKVTPDQTIGNAKFKYLNGNYAFDSYFPDAANVDAPVLSDNIHQRLITYYPKSNTDVPFEQYDTYIISDEGKISAISNFAKVTSGQAFKQELIKWNYEQITRSSSYEGRTIDIVVEPKILIRSGLIK